MVAGRLLRRRSTPRRRKIPLDAEGRFTRTAFRDFTTRWHMYINQQVGRAFTVAYYPVMTFCNDGPGLFAQLRRSTMDSRSGEQKLGACLPWRLTSRIDQSMKRHWRARTGLSGSRHPRSGQMGSWQADNSGLDGCSRLRQGPCKTVCPAYAMLAWCCSSECFLQCSSFLGDSILKSVVITRRSTRTIQHARGGRTGRGRSGRPFIQCLLGPVLHVPSHQD